MRFRLLVAAAVVCSASALAKADEIYTFTVAGTYSELDGTYSFSEPSILTADTTIAPSGLTSVSGAVPSLIYFDPTTTDCPFKVPNPQTSCVEVVDGNAGSTVQTFTTDLTSEGTFDQGYIDLTIGSAMTPEPANFVLLGTGMLGVAGVMRRRLTKDPAF